MERRVEDHVGAAAAAAALPVPVPSSDDGDGGVASCVSGESPVEEPLDPRVGDELEKLNACTEDINALELQLEEANSLFRTLLSDSTHQLKAMSKRLGSCIEKARPYYEALEAYQRAQQECQSAATHYQRASGIHAAAKETIALAEERFLSSAGDWQFDNAWQEMLNHATMKVMEAEKQKTESESVHLAKAASFQAAEAELHRLEKKLSKTIQRSQPYFEQKDVFNKALEAQKGRVQLLQKKVAQCKCQYARSLRNLEDISESIHEQRKRPSLKAREPGVGADAADRGASAAEARRSAMMAPLPSFDLDLCDNAAGSVSSGIAVGSGSTSDDLERATVSGASSSAKGSIEWHGDLDEYDDVVDDPNKSRFGKDASSVLTRSQSCPVETLGALSALQFEEGCEDEADVDELSRACRDIKL